jgi:CheY-like chemotaxis protein
VLVAEDNKLVLYAVKNLLSKLGFEVTALTDRKTALKVVYLAVQKASQTCTITLHDWRVAIRFLVLI